MKVNNEKIVVLAFRFKIVYFYEEYKLRPDSYHKLILNVETKAAPIYPYKISMKGIEPLTFRIGI